MENGKTNGVSNGHHSPEPALGPQRFSDIPRAIDIPVSGGDSEEAVEVDLEELLDDPTELCTLLENENVAKNYWSTIALAYAKQQKVDHAVEIINKGLGALSRAKADERLSLYNCLCWLYLLKSRDAPRVKLETKPDADVKTKDFYLRQATSTLNDASRISPSYSPLLLTRGVLCLLRSSLLQDPTEKSETLRQAVKCFEDALRASRGRNIMALLGRSRAQFSLGKFAEALQGYQQVLERSPDLSDPDPRIGLGSCLWQLGYKDDAQVAWQRALEINPESKIANILLGLYHLNISSHLAITDPDYASSYKKAMVEYTQKAFKLDNQLPLGCATFGNYFLFRKAMDAVDKLARKAIELTDISAIASDGWYLLARKDHYGGDLGRASDFYTRADQARGGDERGYFPAKFGAAQIKVLQQDLDGAKFRLEKIVQQTKSVEAMTLLGTLLAEEAFSTQAGATAEDQANAARKAIGQLEAVRIAWKDPKKNAQPDSSVLLNLSRLYELEYPERSLQCLQQVEQMELDELSDDLRPDELDETALTAYMREHIPPQILNNIACFHYQADRLGQARDLFQTALNACVRVKDRDSELDTDALVTTISFNLARTYEAENLLDEAKQVYEGLLARHSDYVDAKIRLTYIALRQSPTEEGPKAMSQLYEAESADLEVRSLYGWYLRKAKRKTDNVAEDQEQRHFKHTLQGHDKHDRYALTGMGNLYLATAREMRRDTDQEKERRRKMYERAVEFFDKALQLDPRNAYAAQGIGIALVEDKKDFATALQIFTKVRETVKDASVYVNLGHVYCELKQLSRGIECYDAALAKDRARDPQILACLGRAWLLRGKQERSAQAMKTSLDYSQRALQVAPDQIHFRFNIAFVQIQIAQLLYSLPESQRNLEEVEQAALGLDEAIESFSAIAKSPNPPFPRHDIEQRANMGRNTMRRQLERAVQSQREYESKNAARLQQARDLREAEVTRRAAERQKVEQAAEEQRRKVADERRQMQERDRQLAEQRAEEEKRKDDDVSADEETGENKKRTSKRSTGGKRKKKGEEAAEGDTDGDVSEGERRSRTPAKDGAEKPRRKKKRKLERRAPARENSKYKSSEMVVDSDLEDEPPLPEDGKEPAGTNGTATPGGEMEDDADGVTAPRRKVTRIVDEDEDEDGDVGAPETSSAPADVDGMDEDE